MSRSRFRTAVALPVSAALALSTFAAPAPAFAQTASKESLVINEVVSNGDPVADWVELANTDNDLDLDISGWKILDNDDKHTPIVIPEGTKIESGGYYALYTETQTPDNSEGFGLGKGDSVRVYDAEGTLVAETTWEGHVLPSWGRLPDKTGEFGATAEATRGLANKAPAAEKPADGGEEKPAAPVEPWPYENVYSIDLGGDFKGEDMSGVDFDANGRAWVVNNGEGKLYALDYDSAAKKYALAGTWTLKYADGTGTVDAEGVTVGPNGAIYVATERDNSNKKVSRPSVLRFDVPTAEGEIRATHEWNLKDTVGEIDANAGLEAISYIPEQNLFAVGVEADGKVYFLELNDDETYTVKQTYQSPFAGVMALDYRQQDKQLRVLCDEVCDGQSLLLAHNGTEFAPASGVQSRPANMDNFANEGFGTFTSTGKCIDGKAAETTRFLWADDGVTGGISLRGADHVESVDCTADAPETPSTPGAGSASSSSALGGILGVLLAFIAGLLSAGPIAKWVKDTFNIQLPF